MTDASAHQLPPPSRAADDEDMVMPIVVYALYLGGFVTGVTPIVGLVMAYVLKGAAGPRAASHYVFLINTFWIAALAFLAAGVLTVIGFPLLFLFGLGVAVFMLAGLVGAAATLWFAVRCVIGLVRAAQGDGYPDPRTWLA